MEKYAEYIRQVEIPRLWGGRKHILWTLDPEVNVSLNAMNMGYDFLYPSQPRTFSLGLNLKF